MASLDPLTLLQPLLVGGIAGSLLAMQGSNYLAAAYQETLLNTMGKQSRQNGAANNGFVPDLLYRFKTVFLYYILFIITAFLLAESIIFFFLIGYLDSNYLYLSAGFFFLAVALLFVAVIILLLTVPIFKYKQWRSSREH